MSLNAQTAPLGPYPRPATSYSPPSANKTATTSDDWGIVASYVGRMSGEADANINVFKQQTVTINGIQLRYDVSLNIADTFKLLNAFDVSGYGPDLSTNLVVSVVDASGLAGVLIGAITQAAEAPTGTMNSDLDKQVYSQLIAKIQSDGLINNLEDGLASSWYVVDASSGAWDTTDHYSGRSASATVTKADCNLLLQQIPSDTLNRYMDLSEEPLSNALLLRPNDKITFVWDVATKINAAVNRIEDKFIAQTRNSNTSSSISVQPTTDRYQVATQLNLSVPTVRVAVTLLLTNDSSVQENASWKIAINSEITTSTGRRFHVNGISPGAVPGQSLRASAPASSYMLPPA